MMKQKLFPAIILMMLLCVCGSVFGQSVRGRIEGTVKDSQGKVVPNANLTVTNTGTGASLQVTSTDEGGFVVPELQPGTYQITAEITGFKKVLVEGIIVQVATVSNVNIDLEIGAVTEQVTVSAADAQEVVNTSNAEVGDVVDRQRILDLPLDGRNPFELTTLQAGVQSKTNSDGEVASFSVNGNRTVANNLTVDGVNASDNFLKTPANVTLGVIPVSVESIGEFRVTTALPAAEFGRGTSQINAITASGTNDFRGSLFEFHRNTVFNANTFFNNSTIQENGESLAREPLLRNQFGGRLGGPIRKDKTFFFASYEGKRESRGLSRNRLVYTKEARSGIFRYIKGRVTTAETIRTAPGTAPASIIAGVPAGTRTCAGTTTATSVPIGTICVQNVLGINAQRSSFDPIVADYLKNVPTPNNFQIGDGLNTGGYRFNAKVVAPSDQFSTRFDHRINDRNSLEATFNYGDISFDGDYINEGEEAFPGAPYRTRNTIGRGLSTTLRSTITPTIINEARFGAQLSTLTFGNTADTSRGYKFDLATIANPEDSFLASNRNLRVLQWTDNLTFVRGEHTFKTGIELRSFWVRRYTFSGTLPTIDFGTSNLTGFTQNSNFRDSTSTDYTAARVLANTLAGAVGGVTQVFNVVDPSSGRATVGAPEIREYSNWETNAYFQDSWRFRPNLTLNLGLRYEYNTAPRENENRGLLPIGGSAALYGISGDGNVFKPGVLTGSNPVLDIVDGAFYKADKNNFAPVVGFAWDPFKNGKTSVRGGYRISYFQGSFNTIDGTLDDNEGLILTSTQTFASGFLRNGITLAPAPSVTIPAPQSIQTNSTVDIRAFDENLRTPYVHDYSVGVQREIFKGTSLEVRYVGNRGKKLYRGYDVNEVNIFARDANTGQTFLDAFLIAQNNLRLSRAAGKADNFGYDSTIPGSQLNPLFQNVLFANVAGGNNLSGEFTNANYITRLDEGRVGDFADYVSRVRNITGLAGGVPSRGAPFYYAVQRGLLPVNFFRANPSVRGAQLFSNGSTSAYDSLQIELTRRLTGGLRVQASYTFAKGLSDFIGSTGDTNSFLTIRDTHREYAQFNNTHGFVANAIYQLPFGRGRRFLRKTKGVVPYLISGWQTSTIIKYFSGDPLSITSGRGTYNRDDRSASNTVDVVNGLTRNQLQNLVGLQSNANGTYYINPDFAPGSTSNSGAVIFNNPQPGTIGSLGLGTIYGPRNFNVDFSVLKRTRLNERFNVEFRGEIFNILNTVNFDNPNTDINSVNFGRISSTIGRPRLMQFALRLNF